MHSEFCNLINYFDKQFTSKIEINFNKLTHKKVISDNYV